MLLHPSEIGTFSKRVSEYKVPQKLFVSHKDINDFSHAINIIGSTSALFAWLDGDYMITAFPPDIDLLLTPSTIMVVPTKVLEKVAPQEFLEWTMTRNAVMVTAYKDSHGIKEDTPNDASLLKTIESFSTTNLN